MYRPLSIYMTLSCSALLVASHSSAQDRGQEPFSCTDAWLMPVDVEDPDSHESWVRFGWDTFVAINWPHKEDGLGGEPDKERSICTDPADPLWFTYMQKDQTFLPLGADPGTWADPTVPLKLYPPDSSSAQLPIVGGLSKVLGLFEELVDTFAEADVGSPLIDQNGKYVMFEIYLNQSEFEYLKQTQYYDSNTQLQAFEPEIPTFVGFPETGAPDEFNPPLTLPDYAQQGAMELKASWKQLTPDEIASGRFIMREVYYVSNYSDTNPPCGPVTIGLIGMHILRLTPDSASAWYWTTFEQVDNTSTTLPPPATPLLNPGTQATDCPPPYAEGFTCAGEACDEETVAGCPPDQVVPLEGPDVCEVNLDEIVNVSRIPEMAPSPMIQSVNTEYQDALPAPWKYYELVNTLQPDPDGECCIPPLTSNTVNTCYMTNTTMETYTQYFPPEFDFPKCGNAPANSMNCTDCHAAGLPYGAPLDEFGFPTPSPGNPTGTKYQVFTFLLYAAKSSCVGDLDLTMNVGYEDFVAFVEAFGKRGQIRADFNGDGIVDLEDFSLLLINYGSECDLASEEARAGSRRVANTKRHRVSSRNAMN